MAHLGDGLNGYLDVENATLRAPRLEAVSNIGIANTSPEHAFSVGSNLYVSINSPDVLTVDGNVVCEGIKVGLIEILPSYDLAAVSNVGNVTQSTIQFANTTTAFVTTANVEIGGSLVVSGTRGTTLGSGTTAQRSVYPLLGTIRYNSTTGYMEAYTGSGWGSIATPPTIQTFSPASIAVADVTTQVFTVTGAFFDALTTLQLQGADNTLYDVTDFTFTNSGSLGFKMGTLASGQAANRPYKLVVTNGAGLSTTSTTTIGLGAVTWSSPAAGATLTAFSTTVSANNTELAATDEIGGSGVTFSVPASNLPSGLSLNGSTGAITGTIGAATATGGVSVTFRVTDNVTGATLDRTFSIMGFAGLFLFTSFKFTNAGKTGRDGPSLNEIRAHADYDTNANSHGYPPPFWDMTDSSFFNLGVEYNGGVYRNGFQLWTVPATATYRIQAQGAMGGDAPVSPAASPGKGARVQADFALTQGTKINILVGQGGMATTITTGYPHPSPGASNGGGGATWVLKQNFTTSTNDIYLIAGGGTGTSEYGNYSDTGAHGNGATQGTSSNGGAQSVNSSGGGAGWGADGNPTAHNTRGRRPHVGAQGGALNQPTLGEGGFGGGGAGQDHSPGGGGGYGGAGGAYYSNMGGYGRASSWIMTTATQRSFLGNPYNGAAGEAGWVIITKL
jgi:hypothetical protein